MKVQHLFYVKTIQNETIELNNTINIKIAQDRGYKFFHAIIVINNEQYNIYNIPFILLTDLTIKKLLVHLVKTIQDNKINNINYLKWLEDNYEKD